MKVGILHHDLEWEEKRFKELFEKMGFETTLYDVRGSTVEDLSNKDFVLNRVYASVANRDCQSNIRALKMLYWLEKKGVSCINSYLTSCADYSKKVSSEIMRKNQVPNPATIKINKIHEIGKALRFSDKFGFPIVLKRDMGGRGKDVHLIKSKGELSKMLREKLSREENYDQGYVVQEFLENDRGYDCRIAIMEGKFGFAFSRGLLHNGESIPWLASTSSGSKKSHYNPSEEEINLAIKATTAIGAIYNEVDITFTSDGPAVIENNPTPNCVQGEDIHDKLYITANLIKKKFLETKSSNGSYQNSYSKENSYWRSLFGISSKTNFPKGNKRRNFIQTLTSKLNFSQVSKK